MKKILFLLLFLPFVTNGQTELAEKKSDGKMNLISANKTITRPAVRKEGDRKKLKDNEVYLGDVKFKIGLSEITCDSAILYQNEGMLSAYNVKVTNPQSFDIKGTVLSFNKENGTANLNSDITVTAKNGVVIGSSEYLQFDFNYEVYRIINGAINPPNNH